MCCVLHIHTAYVNVQVDPDSSFRSRLKRKAGDAVASFTSVMRTVKQCVTATASTSDIPDVTNAPDN
jgi:hypothetical protein